MVWHSLNQSLLKLIQLADMAEYNYPLFLSFVCFLCFHSIRFLVQFDDVVFLVYCSTMKSSAKVLPRQCMNTEYKPIFLLQFLLHPFLCFSKIWDFFFLGFIFQWITFLAHCWLHQNWSSSLFFFEFVETGIW